MKTYNQIHFSQISEIRTTMTKTLTEAGGVRLLTINDMELNGKTYILNQCEDIWKWFKESVVGEYTHYYYKVVFHTEEGFYAAYADNLSNGCFI